MNPDFKELCQLLDKNEVRYLVVGGYALAAHGRPRYTDDFDVWVEPTPENAKRVLTTLDDFGFVSLDVRVEDLTMPGMVIQLGYPPARIDLLTQPEGVTFEECYPNRAMLKFGGLTLPFLNVPDLIRNKRASARPQDLADVAALEDLENNS